MVRKRILLVLALLAFAVSLQAGGIGTAKEFIQFATDCNNSADLSRWMDADSTIRITADLDFAKEKNIPQISFFDGRLDGQNHSIRNWKAQQALFRELGAGGEIINLRIDASCSAKITSKSTEYRFGFIAEINSGKIDGCENHAPIIHKCTYTSNPVRIGGLVGYNEAYVLNCRNYGKISSECTGVEQKNDLPIELGGLVGGCIADKVAPLCPVIAWCENLGEIAVSTDFPAEMIGGVVGNAAHCTVKFCVNRGNVSSCSVAAEMNALVTQCRVGGVIGQTKMDVCSCDNFGKVSASGKGSGFVGGVIAMPHAGLAVVDCCNYGDVTASNENPSQVGGVIANIGRPVHVRRCFNYGNVAFAGISPKSRSTAGGVVGNIYSPSTSNAGASVRNCANYGDISSSTGGNSYGSTNKNCIHTGGVVGYMEAREGYLAFLKDCMNEGKVTAASGRKGSICGATYNVKTGGYLPRDAAKAAKPLADGSNVYGKVFSRDGSPLAGIRVTDGRQYVTTAADGSYRMKSDLSDTRFVYISIPADFQPQTNDGVPQFFKRIGRWQEAWQADFVLDRKDVNMAYTLLMIADPQVRPFGMDNSMETWRNDVSVDAENFRQALGGETYCINLGDLVYNYMYAYDDYIDGAASIKCPTFNVIGNHDYDQTTMFSTDLGNPWFEAYVSPENYSFDLGDIHYIVLNDILYNRQNVKQTYSYGLDEKTWEWIQNDLSTVSKDHVLMICSHAQLFKKKGDSPNGSFGAYNMNYDNYTKLFSQYKEVYTWAGHYHLNYDYNFAGKATKHGAPNIHSICVSRCTGALRLNKYLNSNGAPQGYMVVNVNGSDMDWWYKSVGHDKDYQMRAFSPVRTSDGYVKVNVWNWSENWSLPEWYENGVKAGDMESHPETDPDYLDLFGQVTNNTTKKYCAPDSDCYMFRIKPSEGCTSGEIRVRDQFGNIYKTTISW